MASNATECEANRVKELHAQQSRTQPESSGKERSKEIPTWDAPVQEPYDKTIKLPWTGSNIRNLDMKNTFDLYDWMDYREYNKWDIWIDQPPIRIIRSLLGQNGDEDVEEKMRMMFDWENDNLDLVLPQPRQDVLNKLGKSAFEALRERMLYFGWCQSTISLLHDAIGMRGLFLACQLGRPVSTIEHDSCTSTQCNGLQTKENKYRRLHVDGCGGRCGELSTDTHKIASILAAGNTPRIRFRRDLQDARITSLEVIDTGPYTAISHVWAHGYGCVSRNAMLQCQLEQIDRYLNSTTGSETTFWIDTLAVPVQKEFSEYRKKALRLLSNIFKQAEAVLVMDRGLQQLKVSSSWLENAIQILGSDWMRRLWTLEEAMLANMENHSSKLHFQFHDTRISFEALLSQNPPEEPAFVKSAYEALRKHLTLRFDAAVRSGNERPPPSISTQRLQHLATALEYRTTSRAEDETWCLAGILGLRTDELLSTITAESRMCLFLRLLRELPPTILFCDGPRIKTVPYCWAPNTFLAVDAPSRRRAITGQEYGLATIDNLGLHARFPGVRLVVQAESFAALNNLGENLTLAEIEVADLSAIYVGKHFNAQAENEGKSPKINEILWQIRPTKWAPNPFPDPRSLLKLVMNGADLAIVMNLANREQGAVLWIEKEVQDVFHTSFVCQVHLTQVKEEDVPAACNWVNYEPLDHRQQWLIK